MKYYETTCKHNYFLKEIYFAEGPNVLGFPVKHYLEKWECIACKTEDIRLFKGTPDEAINFNDSIVP